MTLTTLTLEIRTNFKNPEAQQALLEVVKESARTMLGTAMMLADKQRVEVNLYENTNDGSRIIDISEFEEAAE